MFTNRNVKTVTVPTRLFQICLLSLPIDASTQPAIFVAFDSHKFQTVPLLSIILLHHNRQANSALAQTCLPYLEVYYSNVQKRHC